SCLSHRGQWLPPCGEIAYRNAWLTMRIAFLCKRRYMGKDVILDRFARLYEIMLGYEADLRELLNG
ncbi:MAG: hypothetical protein L0H63_16170, partial [Nitrococcus sp.]|nr:hypothetical protein [Nitrococcus sp.]